MIKRFIIAIVLLAIVCGGIVGFNIFRANAIKQYFATMEQPPSVVSTVTVKPMTWTPGIEAIGTVNARRGVDVAVETSGTVTEINFKANQKVEKGDLLVQLDDEVERADLASAQSALKLARDNLQRIRQLAERGVSATSSLDSAQSQATQAESAVQKLKAVLDQKQLRAPFTGVIGIPKIDIGQYLTAGTAVATLQQLETMRVDFTVPEQEFDNLKLGQTIKVGLTEDDLRFTGEIIGINPKIDPSSRLVTVRGEVDNPIHADRGKMDDTADLEAFASCEEDIRTGVMNGGRVLARTVLEDAGTIDDGFDLAQMGHPGIQRGRFRHIEPDPSRHRAGRGRRIARDTNDRVAFACEPRANR